MDSLAFFKKIKFHTAILNLHSESYYIIIIISWQQNVKLLSVPDILIIIFTKGFHILLIIVNRNDDSFFSNAFCMSIPNKFTDQYIIF